MYSLTVQDHIMIAHSFKGEIFGPAQRVHGATFVVEWELRRARLDQYGLIVDIGLMKKCLRGALDELDYRNLDDVEALKEANTTTEFLCGLIFELLKARIAKGEVVNTDFASMKITLRESPNAWAAYEAALA